MTARGPWLGVDYGLARLGLARSDPSGLVSTPLEVQPSEGMERDAERVANLAARLGVVGVVVGLPSRLDGSASSTTRAAAEFARQLKAACSVPVITWDERLSTVQAGKALRAAGLNRRKRAEHTDKVAAALILQAYLDRQRNSVEDCPAPGAPPQAPNSPPILPKDVAVGRTPPPLAASPETQGKKLPLWAKALATVAVILGILAFLILWLISPPGGGREVKVRVPVNATARVVSLALKEQDLIRNPALFCLLSRLKGVDDDFKAGVHLLNSSLSTPQIISSLAAGDRRLGDVVVTIPEGYSLNLVAQALEDSGVTPKEAFLTAAQAQAVGGGVVSFPLPQGSLEGYLFPDTYYFEPDSQPQAVVAKMLAAFERKVYTPLQVEFANSNLVLHESIVLASLVEREAKLPQERPLIAGVYLNRLRKGMKLECDATVQYALGRHKSRLLYSDLKVNSPYNTYLHPGLPPGPICNPGLDSIRAALRPTESDYLYYVAQPDGSHIFSRTFAEHLSAGG